MKLETAAGSAIDSPSPSEIEHMLGSLDAGNNFAILGPNPDTYLQVLYSDEGFVLEYQVGDTDHHFQSLGNPSRDEVIAAFQRYAVGDDAWKSACEWKQIDLSAEKKGGCAGAVLLLIAVAGGWLVLT